MGKIVVSLLPPPPERRERRFSSILLIRPGGIGDAVLLAPAIQVLKERYPSIQLDVLAEQRNAAIFSLVPGIRNCFRYDVPGELWTVLRRRYDVVIDTEQWHYLSAVVARLIRAPITVGFGTNERRRLFTHPVTYSHDDYEAESFLHLLAPLGITEPALPVCPPLTIPPDACRSADRLLRHVAGAEFVALFPGASIREKSWGVDRFASLAVLLNEKSVLLVVIGGPDDVIAGRSITACRGILDLTGKTGLAETAAILSRARLLVSGDSGVLHLAALLGTRTVALFGPSNWTKWAPRGERHRLLLTGRSCAPCSSFGYFPSCPQTNGCTHDIPVADVFAVVGDHFPFTSEAVPAGRRISAGEVRGAIP